MNQSKGPSQRQLRVAEEVRHILAETFKHQCSGNELLDRSFITVTEVRISPDLQNATVFVTPLGGKNISEIMSALKEQAWYFRREVAHKLPTRNSPRLSFQPDTSFEEARRIEELLNSPHVKQDLGRSEEE